MVGNSKLPLQGAQVRSLMGELRPYKLHRVAKKKGMEMSDGLWEVRGGRRQEDSCLRDRVYVGLSGSWGAWEKGRTTGVEGRH